MSPQHSHYGATCPNCGGYMSMLFSGSCTMKHFSPTLETIWELMTRMQLLKMLHEAEQKEGHQHATVD